MDLPLMKCGHTAQAIDSNNNPVCVICFGSPEALEVQTEMPDLTGRVARCSYYGSTPSGRNHSGPCKRGEPCHCEKPSSPDLAFFEYRPAEDTDRFYCGCWGWD